LASSSPTIQAGVDTKNLKKAKQHRSLAKLEQELIRKDAYIAEREAAREPQPSAQPLAAAQVEAERRHVRKERLGGLARG
jgi:hypothetical protein